MATPATQLTLGLFSPSPVFSNPLSSTDLHARGCDREKPVRVFLWQLPEILSSLTKPAEKHGWFEWYCCLEMNLLQTPVCLGKKMAKRRHIVMFYGPWSTLEFAWSILITYFRESLRKSFFADPLSTLSWISWEFTLVLTSFYNLVPPLLPILVYRIEWHAQLRIRRKVLNPIWIWEIS